MEEKRQALVAELAAAVTAYQRATDAFDEAVAARLDVNRTDLRCLDLLFDGPLTAGQLAAAAGLSPAATTTLIDRLERKGYLGRVRDTADRRRVLVELTDLARQRAWQMYGPLAEEGAADATRRSDAQVKLVIDFLRHGCDLTERHRKRVTEQQINRD
ncbi:MAG TPA: MarR family transcriptional regulator [Micromonosporaceae bacterium]